MFKTVCVSVLVLDQFLLLWVKMKSKLYVVIFVGFAAILMNPLSAIPEEQSQNAVLKQEAVNIVKKFAGTLKPLLKGAIQSGGPSHAINICSNEAPRIAKQLSLETGWTIKRVSLKPRNSKNATADTFERKVLEQFNEKQIKGESPETIVYYEKIGNQFRFMKAQGVEDICLNCHGKTLSADVASALKKHYPDDIATGYSKGEVRGAFSLIKKLE